jgi:hypothetical protein
MAALLTSKKKRFLLPAVNRDWSLLSELFFRFVNLPDEVDEAFAGLGNALLRPVRELNGRRENCVIYQFV